jgi:6,7-dimethyl-8-ribityllumazine synthase
VPQRYKRRAARFAVVRARFNAHITQALLDGALTAFAHAGITARALEVVEVPGAFELPLAALRLAQTNKFAAIVALGCVIRGETPHFEYIAAEASRGLMSVMLQTGVPIGFGLLTTENERQARARSAPVGEAAESHGSKAAATSNKGFEAARVAIEMAVSGSRGVRS